MRALGLLLGMNHMYRLIPYLAISLFFAFASQASSAPQKGAWMDLSTVTESPITYWNIALLENSIDAHLVAQSVEDRFKVFFRFLPTSEPDNCNKNYSAKLILGQLELILPSNESIIVPITDTNKITEYEKLGIDRTRPVRMAKTQNVQSSKFAYCRIDLNWLLESPISTNIKTIRYKFEGIILDIKNKDEISINSSGVFESGDWQGLYE